MTLEQSVVLEHQEITLIVTIGNVRLAPSFQILTGPLAATTLANGIPACMGYSLRKDIDTKDPVCDLKVNFVPDWLVDGMVVTVDVGYDTFTVRRFTGTVQNLQHAIGTQTIECHGNMWLLVRQLDVPDINVTGQTVDQAIVARLGFVGITNHQINVSPFVLGSVVATEIPAGQTLDQVAQLLDIADGVLYELGNGTIIGVPNMYYLPSSTSFRAFSTVSGGAQVRIIDSSDREDPDYFRDKTVATGASIPDGDPADPDTVFNPLTSTWLLVGANVRQPPAPAGTFATQEFSNDLIDVQAELDAYAQRKATKYGRIPRYLTIQVIGDPRIELGMTLAVEIPENRVAGNWFVASFTEECSKSGLTTTCELTGGSRFGGSLAAPPTASFVYTATQQVFNDRVYTIITADASASHDPDGAVVSYDWSGAFTGSGVRVVFIIDQAADPSPDLTLTVTDTGGLTGTDTQSINTDPNGGGVFVAQPSAWVSGDAGGISGSPDGGATFNNLPITNATAVDAKPANGTSTGIAMHGTDDGSLYRTTDFDLNATQVYVGTGDLITFIWWDKNVPTRVWASTLNGALLRSDDDGGSFVLHRAATGYPIWTIGTPQPGGVWVFGGRGDDPTTFVQYDAAINGIFQSAPFGGDADFTGATAALTCSCAASRVANELMLGFKGELAPFGTNVIHTNSVFVGSGWLKAIGVDGKQEVRFVVPDFGPGVFHLGFDDQSVWHTLDAISPTAPTFTETPAVFPANHTPNQALWEGDVLGGLDGVYLVALSNSAGDGLVVKSVDALETASPFYPVSGLTTAPAGFQALAVAIGAPGNGVAQAGAVAVVGGTVLEVDAWDQSSTWVSVRAAMSPPYSGFGNAPLIFFRFVDGTLLIAKRVNFSPHRGSIYYSAPGDADFALVLGDDAVNVGYHPHGMDITADGIILVPYAAEGLTGNQATMPMNILSSPDKGATWGTEYADPGYTGGNNTEIFQQPDYAIACDKWDANRVLVFAGGSVSGSRPTVIYRDATGWHQRLVAVPNISSTVQGIVAVNNGRMILLSQTTVAVPHANLTDDLGASWSESSYLPGAGKFIPCPYRANHFNRVILGVNVAGNVRLAISSDNGANFTEPLAAPFADNIVSLEYDNANDTVYVILNNGTVLMVAALYSGTPVVTDITFNLIDSPRVIALLR